MVKRTRRLILVGLSMGFVALVAISAAGAANFLFFAIVLSAAIAMTAIAELFPRSGLFPITFASLTAVYASIFALFAEAMFYSLGAVTLGVGFAAPILLFIAGCWWRRDEIRAEVVDSAIVSEKSLPQAFLWQLPVWVLGLGLYLLFGVEQTQVNTDATFLASMGVMGVFVFAASPHVVTFLIDIGLLLDEFVTRMGRLLIPALAFLSFYAILVIIFAALYGIISHSSAAHEFRIGAEHRSLTYFEALYFSVATLATVGYGDIVPSSNLVRALVALEVIIGVLLILFGVSELLEYANERQGFIRKKHKRLKRTTSYLAARHPRPHPMHQNHRPGWWQSS